MSKYSTFGMAGIGMAAAVGFVFAIASISGNFPNPTPPFPPGPSGPEIFTPATNGTTTVLASTQTVKKFSSIDDLRNFLQSSLAIRERLAAQVQSGGGFFGAPALEDRAIEGGSPQSFSPPAAQSDEKVESNVGSGSTYSTTNVQVANVDEPDFLKNDDKYVYIVSGDRLTIIDAFPAEEAEIIVKVGLDIQEAQYLQNMFLNGDRLAIFYQEYGQDYVIPEYSYVPQPVYLAKTHIIVMDVSDREDPQIIHDYEVTGNYNNARMIGNYVYLITNSDLDYTYPVLPRVMESSKVIATPEIYYFDNPEPQYGFSTVTSVNMFDDDKDTAVNSETYLMNPAGTIYVSEDNIYITYQKYMPYYYYETNNKDKFFNVIVPLLPEDVQQEIKSIEQDDDQSPSEKWDSVSSLLQDLYNRRLSEDEKNRLFGDIQEALSEYDARVQRDIQKTVIHKIAIGSNGTLQYSAKGDVSGRLLNQFSMDEDGDRFRIATTSEYYSQYRSFQDNNVYVLDEELKTVGSLEKIAPDESIYAARFIGDRLYLVTFRQVDPFFVIDLSEDEPEVLGKLKLPGYSNYLHPYDKDHIIGIGREQGVKLALFDVSDVENPVTVDVYEIGDFGTDSEVLGDHKAFLFDKEKNILSIPVTMSDYGIPVPLEGQRSSDTGDGVAAGDVVTEPPERYFEPRFWRGFYVFGVDPEDGFTLKGKIEHFNDRSDGYYPYGYGIQGSRSFFIDGVLYTVSVSNLIKMNELEDLTNELKAIDLGGSGGIIKYEDSESRQGSTSNDTATSTS